MNIRIWLVVIPTFLLNYVEKVDSNPADGEQCRDIFRLLLAWFSNRGYNKNGLP